MYYDNFKDLCELHNVRPSDITRETGITSTTFSAWKKGTYTPKQTKLQQIADFFGVPVTTLTGEPEITHEEIRNNHQTKQLVDDFLKLDLEDRRTVLVMVQSLLRREKYSQSKEIEEVLNGES